MQFCAGHLPLCVTHTHTHSHAQTQKHRVCQLSLAPEGNESTLSPFTLTVGMTPWGVETVWRLWASLQTKRSCVWELKKRKRKTKKKQLGNLNDRDWKETFYSLAFFFPWCATKLIGWTQTETWKAMACTLHIWLPKHSRTRTIYCDCFMLTLNPLGWLKYCQIGRDFWEQVLLLVE